MGRPSKGDRRQLPPIRGTAHDRAVVDARAAALGMTVNDYMLYAAYLEAGLTARKEPLPLVNDPAA